jgi:membrane associated rhomboid family serine protease
MIPLRDDAPRYRFPGVNTTLICINVLIFIYEWQLPQHFLEGVFLPTFALVPARVAGFFHGMPVPIGAVFLPFLTSMFLHGGWMHLIGNMWMLYLFGDNVEDVFGHFGYLAFYLFCGCVAGFVQVIVNLHSQVPNLGASGAIAGVMGAYFIRFPRARVLTLVFLVIFYTLMELPAWIILGYWFVIQFFSGAISLAAGQMVGQTGGIAWFAHIGGFVTGLLLVQLAPRGPTRLRSYQWQ